MLSTNWSWRWCTKPLSEATSRYLRQQASIRGNKPSSETKSLHQRQQAVIWDNRPPSQAASLHLRQQASIREHIRTKTIFLRKLIFDWTLKIRLTCLESTLFWCRVRLTATSNQWCLCFFTGGCYMMKHMYILRQRRYGKRKTKMR